MVALKTLVFTILVPGTVTVILPWLLLQGTGGLVLPGPSLWLVGLLPLLLGVGLSVWCAGAFTDHLEEAHQRPSTRPVS